jgi:hypothetical protein
VGDTHHPDHLQLQERGRGRPSASSRR